MKKTLLFGISLFLTVLGKAQFTQNDLLYYVGEGPDTAVLVIDFLDETDPYAWGYLFDATESVTAEAMLSDISDDEAFLTVELAGGFLNNIYYNQKEGVAGDPNYWGTWSKDEEGAWYTNGGVSEVLENGEWFGCSYTDFDPALEPNNPIAAYASKWFSKDEIVYTVGEGDDTAIFVIDFVTAGYSEAVSYAWAYAFDGVTTGGEILADLAADDINLDVDAGAFLNDIIYNQLEGIGGDPHYWGTWSGTNLSDWEMNAGLSTEVNDGDWFGCSYAEWAPRRPWTPIPSISADALIASDLDFVIGEGENQVVIVIDFNERVAGGSYAYGYNFDTETILASEVLEALHEADYGLTIDLTGGFLNSISSSAYGEEGIGGSPYYWSTWNATNAGGWYLNSGIGEELSDGDWFGCSYTSWSPATPPSVPVPGLYLLSVEQEDEIIGAYPNPTAGTLTVPANDYDYLNVYDAQGRMVFSTQETTNNVIIDLNEFENGVYILEATIGNQTSREKIILNK